jgi:hypothetical protein
LYDKPPWRSGAVKRAQEQVASELAALRSPTPAAKLTYLSDRIRALEDDLDPAQQLYRYVCAMTALVTHARSGGLTKTAQRSIVDLAYAVLETHGVKPETSHLSYLYGDLHLIMAQIARREGAHFVAAWEQAASWHMSRAKPSGGLGFQLLNVGNRALRLGDATYALSCFVRAEATASDATGSAFEQARLGRIKTLRLTRQLAAANELVAATRDGADFASTARQELDWEAECVAAMMSGDLEPLVRRTRRRGSHHMASYVLEAYFWARSVGRERWHAAFPLVRTMAREKSLRLVKQGRFYKCALTLERCSDEDVPLGAKLRFLARDLARVGQLISIDKELLVRLASARWLVEAQVPALARLMLHEYAGLCLKLTGGASSDVYGAADDLFARVAPDAATPSGVLEAPAKAS